MPLETRHYEVLDHGYIRYVDHMGDDNAPLESARMSTAKETGVDVAADDRLRERLWKDQHCYDAETEVLTDHGFVRWPDLKIDAEGVPTARLGIWDPARGLCYERPKSLVSFKHSGPMYRVDHGGVDLLVTPNHKMLVRLYGKTADGANEWSAPSLIPADELGDRSMVRYTKLAPYTSGEDVTFSEPGLDSDSPRALLRLMGFFIGDGNATGYKNAITFHLKKARKIAWLKETCLELGWPCDELSNGTFVVRKEVVAETFRTRFYGDDGEKRVWSRLLMLNSEDAAALLDGLRQSDGSTKRGAWEYSTSVREVAEAIQIIALHAGEAAHVNTRRADSPYPMYGVMFLSRMREPIINQGKRQTSMVNYDGHVYCAHTRTGILVVRRNGKIVLSGNTTPFEACELVVELQLPIFCLRQLDRHRTVSRDEIAIETTDEVMHAHTSRNEFSGRYSTMLDLFYIPKAERVKRKGTLNKQGSAEPLPQAEQTAWVETWQAEAGRDRRVYESAVASGMASELARIHLPLNQYTKVRLKACMLNWFKTLNLRLRPDVQWETRVYTRAIGRICRDLWPKCWALFEEHSLYGARLSRTERDVVRQVLLAAHAGAITTSAPLDVILAKLADPGDFLEAE